MLKTITSCELDLVQGGGTIKDAVRCGSAVAAATGIGAWGGAMLGAPTLVGAPVGAAIGGTGGFLLALNTAPACDRLIKRLDERDAG